MCVCARAAGPVSEQREPVATAAAYITISDVSERPRPFRLTVIGEIAQDCVGKRRIIWWVEFFYSSSVANFIILNSSVEII